MARRKSNAKPQNDEALVVTDAELVEVRWYDGSTLTFTYIVDGRTVRFVDGVAKIDAALADKLRKRGVVV